MRIHFIGINGVSMRALADFVAARGHDVTGSDRDISGHNAKNVIGADLVVYTNAIPEDNCELKAAREMDIPTVERATYLGELSKTYDSVIAVAGCHGKSTATAMLGKTLGCKNPTVHVGVARGSQNGSDRLFITEACEYRASFLHLKPDVGIILNVGYDHPDYYTTEQSLVDAYRQFGNNCKTLIVNGDDETARRLRPSPITFGVGKHNDYRAADIRNENGYRSFIYISRKTEVRIKLPVAGEHNVYNALAALTAADVCGVRLSDAMHGLDRFCGIPRRFERKGIAFGKTVFVDYAHHPAEIAATIKTAKEIFPSVAVVFQPHTYTRTASLMDDFADSLAAADTVILAPIFSAREKPLDGVTSHALCRKIIEKKEKAYCFDTFSEIIDHCSRLKEKAVIFMGAGDIDLAADGFMEKGRLN